MAQTKVIAGIIFLKPGLSSLSLAYIENSKKLQQIAKTLFKLWGQILNWSLHLKQVWRWIFQIMRVTEKCYLDSHGEVLQWMTQI